MGKPQRKRRQANVLFSSAEGLRRFHALAWKPSHARLWEAFQPQENPVFCAVASAATALNSWAGPADKIYQHNFLTSATDRVKPRRHIGAVGKPNAGMTLDQLARILKARQRGLRVQLVRPSPTGLRSLMARYQKSGKFRVIGNFLTREIWGGRGGHFSPFGGYHAGSDSVLVLDVAIHRSAWYWCPVDRLARAMAEADPETGEPRGCLVIHYE